jgi:hypothetical protein
MGQLTFLACSYQKLEPKKQFLEKITSPLTNRVFWLSTFERSRLQRLGWADKRRVFLFLTNLLWPKAITEEEDLLDRQYCSPPQQLLRGFTLQAVGHVVVLC